MNIIKVSVIIPIYNVEQYIEECLLSVLEQSLKEIEVICVNDGTKDRSMEVIEKYAESDSRIVIINKENGGLSSARNAGIEIARGEYLYFLDSDDSILKDTLEILYEHASREQLDNIYFDADAFYETDSLRDKLPHYMEYYHRPADFEEVKSGPSLFAAMELRDCYRPSACLQMPKRQLLLEHNIRFYEGIIHEDQLFTLQVILVANRAKHIALPLYQRRVRDDSIMTGDKTFFEAYSYFVCLQEFRKYLDGFHFPSQDITDAISKRLCTLQWLCSKVLDNMDDSEIRRHISEYPVDVQYAFSLTANCVVRARKMAQASKSEKKELQRKLKKETKQKNAYKNSREYRLGRMLLFIPKGFIKTIRSIRNKGLLCTAYAVKRALFREKKNLKPNKICISIIIPMYNCEKYVSACLDNLLQQTFAAIEIICVNDGSTDDTPSIVEAYAARDSRIRLLNQENQGAGPARNNGMALAVGEYMLFLDADDMFDEKLCEKTYYKARYEMADIVLYGARRLNMQTGKTEPMGWVLNKKLIPETLPFSAKKGGTNLYQLTSGCPWSKLFRRDFIRKNNISFQNLQNANDVFFVRTALAAAKRITVVEDCLVTYRFNGGSSIQSRKNKAPLEFYKAFKALKEELIQRGIYDRMEKTYINMVMTESFFNLDTAGTPEAKAQVETLLKEEAFAFFEFPKYHREDFDKKELYDRYLLMTADKSGH